jgi:hypothetical protein
MAVGNVKRGFNRLHIVATVVWILYGAVVFPLQEVDKGFTQDFNLYISEENVCHENAINGSTADLNAASSQRRMRGH